MRAGDECLPVMRTKAYGRKQSLVGERFSENTCTSLKVY